MSLDPPTQNRSGTTPTAGPSNVLFFTRQDCVNIAQAAEA